jgi:hypothetical protein
MKETDQGKTIENEPYAHGAPLPCVRGGDLEVKKTDPSKNPSPLAVDLSQCAQF